MKNKAQTSSFEDVLDAMAHVQRRKLLLSLTDHNPQNDSPVVVDSDEDADAVERFLRMKHVHLPKLEKYGFIDWDEDGHEVTKGPNFDEIKPLLKLLNDHDDELPADWV